MLKRRPGKQRISVPTAMLPSTRASVAPTQKCAPKPKATCRLGVRRMSNVSGAVNQAGSRLAAVSIWNAICPFRRVRPPSSAACFMSRDWRDTGLS
jgi:hypothetical protein